MFGFVTPDDRARWQQSRQAAKHGTSASKKGAKSTVDTLIRSAERKITSKMRAADQITAQEEFEEANTKTTNKKWDAKSQSIVETVDYSPKDGRSEFEATDDRPEVDSDFQL